MKTSTDRDQTKHLYELGFRDTNCRYIKNDIFGPAAFTISDFLEILPNFLEETDWHDGLELRMDYDSILGQWIVGYYAITTADKHIRFTRSAKELLDALYKLVVLYKTELEMKNS